MHKEQERVATELRRLASEIDAGNLISDALIISNGEDGAANQVITLKCHYKSVGE
jgi:hypothetical protein